MFSNRSGLYILGKRIVRKIRNFDPLLLRLTDVKRDLKWSLLYRIVVETHTGSLNYRQAQCPGVKELAQITRQLSWAGHHYIRLNTFGDPRG